MVPTGKSLPDGCEGVWKDVPELSLDVGSFHETGALLVPKGTVTVISEGKVLTTGGVPSAVGKKHKYQT